MEKAIKSMGKSSKVIRREIKKIFNPLVKRWEHQEEVNWFEKTWLMDENIVFSDMADGIILDAMAKYRKINRSTLTEPGFKRLIIRVMTRELNK